LNDIDDFTLSEMLRWLKLHAEIERFNILLTSSIADNAHHGLEAQRYLKIAEYIACA